MRCSICGSDRVSIEQVTDREYGYRGWTDDWGFRGFEVKCYGECSDRGSKVIRFYDLDELEDLVSEHFQRGG